MTCTTCERIRRFFNNGVQKLAPFTEYTDEYDNVYVVANRTGEIVGVPHQSWLGGKIEVNEPGTYMIVRFIDGQAMGLPIKTSRKVFGNRYQMS